MTYNTVCYACISVCGKCVYLDIFPLDKIAVCSVLLITHNTYTPHAYGLCTSFGLCAYKVNPVCSFKKGTIVLPKMNGTLSLMQ